MSPHCPHCKSVDSEAGHKRPSLSEVQEHQEQVVFFGIWGFKRDDETNQPCVHPRNLGWSVAWPAFSGEFSDSGVPLRVCWAGGALPDLLLFLVRSVWRLPNNMVTSQGRAAWFRAIGLGSKAAHHRTWNWRWMESSRTDCLRHSGVLG